MSGAVDTRPVPPKARRPHLLQRGRQPRGVAGQGLGVLRHPPVLLRLVLQGLHLRGEVVQAHGDVRLLVLQPRQPGVHLEEGRKTGFR